MRCGDSVRQGELGSALTSWGESVEWKGVRGVGGRLVDQVDEVDRVDEVDGLAGAAGGDGEGRENQVDQVEYPAAGARRGWRKRVSGA